MEILDQFLHNTNKTLLCVGPLSSNIIDVSLDFSKTHQLPLILVASRRQIECQELGAGYVNNWSTQGFANYVNQFQNKYIYFERDHGGPWQGDYEIKSKSDVEASMRAAKKSYEVDIDSGFHILHVDPSNPINRETLSYEKIISRVFELYGHVQDYAKSRNKKIWVEIGTEEQSGSFTDTKQLESFLNDVSQFCAKNKFETPKFVVIQTGAKVIETRNVGIFERGNRFDINHLINNIVDSVAIAKKFNIYIKEHNADYLSYENLSLRSGMGIKAANVAPELGHVETKVFLHFLTLFGNKFDLENYLDIVYSSNKWNKWVQPESQLSKSEKVILAGHYCNSDPRVIEIKERLKRDLQPQNIHLDEIIKKEIKSVFYKYATAFGHV